MDTGEEGGGGGGVERGEKWKGKGERGGRGRWAGGRGGGGAGGAAMMKKYALRDTLSPPTQLLFKRYGNARRRDQCYSHASAIKTHLDGILNLTEFS